MDEISDLLDELESKVGEESELLIELTNEYNDLAYSIRYLKKRVEKTLSE